MQTCVTCCSRLVTTTSKALNNIIIIINANKKQPIRFVWMLGEKKWWKANKKGKENGEVEKWVEN